MNSAGLSLRCCHTTMRSCRPWLRLSACLLPACFIYPTGSLCWRENRMHCVKAQIHYQAMVYDSVWSNQLLLELTESDITIWQCSVSERNPARPILIRHTASESQWNSVWYVCDEPLLDISFPKCFTQLTVNFGLINHVNKHNLVHCAFFFTSLAIFQTGDDNIICS